jgi:hypothetical protein
MNAEQHGSEKRDSKAVSLLSRIHAAFPQGY